MKVTAVFAAVCISMSLTALGSDVPQSLRERIENPPSISKKYKSSYTFNTSSAMIEGKDFVSFIELAKQADADRATYRFRSYSKHHKLEVSGKGEVFERYYEMSDPFSENDDSEVVDRGSQLHIHAGLFKVEWSSGNHIYFGRGFTVVEAEEREYEVRIKELQQNADQAATHPAETRSVTEPRASKKSAVYAKVILPVRAPEDGNHPAVESWIARKLRKRGATEFRAVTNWVRLAEDGKQSTAIWNATLDGVPQGCPVEGNVSKRTASGRVKVTLSGWAPFPPKIKGDSLSADIGSRRIAVVDTERTDGLKSYVALMVAPSTKSLPFTQ